MNNFVRYEIYPEEPVRMSRQGDQANTESLSYIPGSALRGAFIGKYIREKLNGCADKAEKDKNLYEKLFKNTKFFDAYISHEGRSLLPTPFVYYADKHTIREHRRRELSGEEAVGNLRIHSCGRSQDKPEEDAQRIGSGKYCCVFGNVLHLKSVKKEAALYVALGESTNDNKIFRYEAISPGQTFTGFIECIDDEAALECKKLLAGSVLYLGGAKGSGYGRCQILKAGCVSWEEIRKEFAEERNEDKNLLTVYALSNLIITDKYGRPTGRMPEGLLEKELGITELRQEKAYLAVFRTGGFNHKWKAGQVQQTAIAAGSVYIYSYSGNIDPEKISDLEKKGIGSRREEGFGRILLNLSFDQDEQAKLPEIWADTAEHEPSAEEKAVLREIAERISENRMAAKTESAAYNTAKASAEDPGFRVFTLAQISRLHNKLQNLSPEHPKEDIMKFKDGLKARTKEAYEKAHLKLKYPNEAAKSSGEAEKRSPLSKSMLEALEDLADDEISAGALYPYLKAEKEEQIFDGISIGKEDSFEIKRRMLTAVLYNLMRMEGGKS